ncbi:MAG TPA: tetraacyldisaccharide 4'-kinase [Desulfobulbaceae bacterium]|nr:tetraacyldisaccharide 4'-kinase [Desulfobulbaceae bacterium]
METKLLFMLGRPFSPVYGALMRMREGCYRHGLFTSERLPVPVISVGNLTLGGTGKTPMVQYMARLLLEHGYKPAVISRGYGGSTKEAVNVVSDGRDVLLPADLVGDEPRLLAETLPGVMVLTGVVRRLPARYAVDMGADVLLLDDGFQHMAVARDLDLVLFSADHLAGNSRIFPGGDLREPVAALGRSSCFVLTNVTDDNKQRADRFGSLLRQRFPKKAIFMSSVRVTQYVQRDNADRFTLFKEKPVACDRALALCGIARPESFKKTLADCNIDVCDFLAMPDHHRYKEADIARIRFKIKKQGARGVVTTEKDMVKLGGVELGVPVYGLRLRVEVEKELTAMVLTTVSGYLQKKNGSTGLE